MWRAAAIALLGSLVLLSGTDASGEQKKRRPKAGHVLRVSVTAYCLDGETKSGIETRRGIVAADPTVLPIGSVIRLRGLRGNHNRQYSVQDTGREIKGNDIDIYMPNCAAAKRFGRQRGRARIVRLAPPESRR
jgi:3D (Asp-Asp-Asp) domain-containing protein